MRACTLNVVRMADRVQRQGKEWQVDRSSVRSRTTGIALEFISDVMHVERISWESNRIEHTAGESVLSVL
jgi:hypothetical protein